MHHLLRIQDPILTVTPRTLFLVLAATYLFGCQPKSGHDDENGADTAGQTETDAAADNTIAIVTESMDFKMPDTISSGWHTFRYINKSNETHFFLLERFPEGKTVDNSKNEVIPAFQAGMDLINAGKPEESGEAFAKIPAWYQEVRFHGGSGLVSAGGESITTVLLEPGYYVVECYVKMPTGQFHSSMGMLRGLVVTEDASSNAEPEADIAITVSTEQGIVYDKAIRAGERTFSVHFNDQKVYENFVGHDVHLVRIDDTGKLFDLENWMNWADPRGLITPAPAGLTFLGGMNDLPAGGTGYFTADLAPGQYAFVAEVPNAMSKNLLKVFEVN